MSLCVQRIQKREHLKPLFRPPDQENRDVTTPSDSWPTGRHHQTKSGRSQSVLSSCAGPGTSKAALRGLPVLSLQPHTCGAPEMNCKVSSTKRLSLYSISTSALQGRGPSVLGRNLLLQASLVERLQRVWPRAATVWGSGLCCWHTVSMITTSLP